MVRPDSKLSESRSAFETTYARKAATSLAELHIADAKSRELAERLSGDFLNLLERCHSEDLTAISVYIPAYDWMTYCQGAQLSDKRLDFANKAFDLLHKRQFFRSSELRGVALFEWLMTALYFPNKSATTDAQLDAMSDLLQEHAASVKGKDAEWRFTEAVGALVVLYDSRGEHSKSVALVTKLLTLTGGCSSATIAKLRVHLQPPSESVRFFAEEL